MTHRWEPWIALALCAALALLAILSHARAGDAPPGFGDELTACRAGAYRPHWTCWWRGAPDAPVMPPWAATTIVRGVEGFNYQAAPRHGYGLGERQ